MDLIILVLVVSIIAWITWQITVRLIPDPTIRGAVQLLIFVVLLLYVLRRFNAIPNVL